MSSHEDKKTVADEILKYMLNSNNHGSRLFRTIANIACMPNRSDLTSASHHNPGSFIS